MITTVVFDIGMVLIGFDWERYMRELFDEETAVRVTRAMFGGSAWKELDRAVLSEEEVLARFYEAEPDLRKEIDECRTKVNLSTVSFKTKAALFLLKRFPASIPPLYRLYHNLNKISVKKIF